MANPRRKSVPPASTDWTCPACRRVFTRKNQRHACGTGDRGEVLRNRPASLVATYDALERYVKSLGEVEVVARQRYVLLRTRRIFADLSVMTDALRLAIHLGRRLADPLFFKVVEDRKKVTHVCLVEQQSDLDLVKGYLREAYELSLAESPPARLGRRKSS